MANRNMHRGAQRLSSPDMASRTADMERLLRSPVLLDMDVLLRGHQAATLRSRDRMDKGLPDTSGGAVVRFDLMLELMLHGRPISL